ncbi:caffeic acid [Musa troglodytarum]|uniref:Caffeic acid n=1 Tax=Musa troglodytarum TaxID=320322 RepID=A0A9E7F380_9LILI|nr:caffeic acid [Musa troglodytarum]
MPATNDVFTLTAEEEEEACTRALQLSCGAVLPMVLKVAIELGLLQIIVKAGPATPLSSEEIAAQLPSEHPEWAAPGADRIPRLPAANKIVGCIVEAGADDRRSRKYCKAPICKYLTENEDGSLANLLLLHHDKVFLDLWHYLKGSVLDGGLPVMAAYGMSSFDYQGADPRFNKIFNEAMRGHTAVLVNQLLRTYGGFDDVKVLVDVGGGVGATLGMITSRHPHIKGINLDLPHVISSAQPLPGVQHVSGDMFEAVPSGDAIFLKALPEKGKVIVIECVLPVVPEAAPRDQYIYQLDICMSTYNIGGKERTEQEFHALAMDAGFSGFKALPMFAGTCIMEFTK